MKKIIYSLFLLLTSTLLFSQTFTEKWNSLYDRYEIFNSSGVMIAYKKYNSLYSRWETYNLQTSNDKGYEIQQPQSSFNAELAKKTLNTLQSKYDNNLAKLKEVAKSAMEYIYACAKTNGYSYEAASNVYKIYKSKYLDVINNGNYDLSSDITTEKLISFIRDGAFKISCDYLNECE
jgi:hypothetical protein